MHLKVALLALVLAAGLGIPTGVQSAMTFTVNSTADPGDGVCDVSECTLREAIDAANTSPGTDTIAFSIAGVGPHTIQPVSALPTITDPVIIDGTTEPDFAGTPVIELNGSISGGLFISGGNSTVRGLVINRAETAFFVDSSDNVIEGNYIGTDVTGTAALGGLLYGVFIFGGSNNTIGGTIPQARNIISGYGIAVLIAGDFGGGSGNVVQGNFIGTDVTGSVPLGNLGGGVRIHKGANNTIGGVTPGAGNLISANGSTGISISHPEAAGNVVQGNFIGTDATGTASLGNGGSGVGINDGLNTVVGGATPGAGNIIAFNGGVGLVISGSGNAVLSNSIFSNGGLGIDLAPGGVTANDAGDADTGANDLQNFPVLISVTSGSTTIDGTLNSTPNGTFTLEFFSNSVCDASGHGEGDNFLGSTVVSTDGNGDASFTVTFPDTVPVGQFITATATNAGNNTSEFSRCDICQAVATPWMTPVSDGDCDGFTTADEGSIGTDPNVACDNGVGLPDWAVDFDNNKTVNVVDVLALKPVFGTPSARHDLDASGGPVNIVDVLKMKSFFNQTCT